MSITPTSHVSQVPQIALFLSRSPLLSSSSPDQSVSSSGNNYFNSYAFNADDILATFLGPSRAPAAKQAIALSSLSSFPSSFASSSGSSGERLSSCGSSSCPLSSASGCSSEEVDKPLPHIPVTATAKEIIALLDLLDRFDADVANEVERVKEGIRDVRDLVGAYTRERRVREGEARKTRAREKRETKGIDSDFWLGL